jgi:hypothetical protein
LGRLALEADFLANGFGQPFNHSTMLGKNPDNFCHLRFNAAESLVRFAFELQVATFNLRVSAIRLRHVPDQHGQRFFEPIVDIF